MQKSKPERVAVILGGTSREREISLRSGENVYQALKRRGYDVIKLEPDYKLAENLILNKIDCAYIMLHGKPGEDGSVQGLLELINIPYTGSGILSSALAMDKRMTKKIFRQCGIPTSNYIELNFYDDIKSKIKEFSLRFPLIVKPATEGSSIGVTKVEEEYKLESILIESRKIYHDLIIEEFIQGKEVTVGVLGDDQNLSALPILELVPKKDFYDYEAKYTRGLTEFIIPARLSDEMTEKVKETAKNAHRALGCYSVSRVDMIVQDDKIFVLEVNTIPGMTQTSDLPAQARSSGIEFDELVERILELGFWRRRK